MAPDTSRPSGRLPRRPQFASWLLLGVVCHAVVGVSPREVLVLETSQSSGRATVTDKPSWPTPSHSGLRELSR